MSIQFVGAQDRKIRLFEGLFPVEKGMRYNSYAIIDRKIAVMDSVDESCVDEWLCNIKNAVGERTPDYLIVQHMEPDHSAGLSAFAQEYPSATLVASAKAFVIVNQLFSEKLFKNRLIVKDTDELCLGRHTLRFIAAPMVHWPEVIVTYEKTTKTLFSADAFGRFGTEKNVSKDGWIDEARRYYFGIVGKYGKQVQALLSRLSFLPVQTICPLHGPVLERGIEEYIRLYDIWSSYRPEKRGVAIICASVYGNTAAAAHALERKLNARGVETAFCDIVTGDLSRAVANAFAYDRLAVATTTYNGGVFPKMEYFLRSLIERNYQNRTVGMIENGSWSPMAAKTARALLEGCNNITIAPTVVTVRSAMNGESEEALKRLAEDLAISSTDC